MNGVNPDKSWDYVFMAMIGIAVITTFIFMLMWNAKADAYGDTEE